MHCVSLAALQVQPAVGPGLVHLRVLGVVVRVVGAVVSAGREEGGSVIAQGRTPVGNDTAEWARIGKSAERRSTLWLG